MSDPATGPDPDTRRAHILIAIILSLLVLVAGLTWLFGLSAIYIAGALATPLFLAGIIQLALESANPDHARAPLPTDEDEAA